MKAPLPLIMLPLLLGCSCNKTERTSESTTPDRIRTLDEMPAGQLHVFLKGHAGDWRRDTDRSRGVPPPPIEKPCPSDVARIALVKPDQLKLGTTPLAAVINQRRSRRAYTADSLTNDELSFLLWSTQGIVETKKDEQGRVINQFRTVPSGGARHPFETYLAINRVDGIAPGIYRYLPTEHQLALVREDRDLPKALTDACYGQAHAGQAAVLFIWSAIPYRTEWAYGYLAPKLIAVDAGHVCENLYLAAESIGSGACAILGYDQATFDRLIQVDGNDEFTFYLASVGKVKR